jgi:hypothetical protein
MHPEPRSAQTPDARRILFVPQGSRLGIGEYARLLTLAHSAVARWPGVDIAFAARAELPRFEDDTFPRQLLREDPRRDSIERAVRAAAPDVVVFNNIGRGPELAAARRARARVVYIASVPHYRERAFRRQMLRQMDAMWIFPARESDRRLTPSEEDVWHRGGRPPISFLDSVFVPPEPERAARLRESLGIDRDGYALFVPGGGGWEPRGRLTTHLFVEAAAATARASGVPAVAVLGPLHREAPTAPQGVRLLGYLRQPALMDLIDGARVVATGGGGVLYQALALGAACVAAPLHESDQPTRVAGSHERGLLLAAEPEPAGLARAALTLLADDALRARLRARLAESGPRNELQRCMDLLARHVDAGARPPPAWQRLVSAWSR